MTFEDALQLAQSGDAEAMFSVGLYYYDQEKYLDACDWCERSAKAGCKQSYTMTVTIHRDLATAFLTVHQWSDSFSHWRSTNEWCRAIICDATGFFNESEVATAEHIFNNSLFGMGLCLYRTDDFSGAMTLLTHGIDYDDRCKLLFGLCILGNHENFIANMREAYQYLQIVETKHPEIGNDLIFQALYNLSVLYREARLFQINGVATDVERAYHCILSATKLPGNLGATAQEELKKYRKKMFGGYTYTG